MQHRKRLILIILILLLAACQQPTATPTGESPTAPGEPTLTPLPTTPAPTETPDPDEPLVTLNKVACPEFQCGVDPETGPMEGWLTYNRSDAPVEYWQEGNPRHILSSWAALSYGTTNNILDGGLYQVKDDLQVGAYYRLNCWAFAFAGDPLPGAPSTGFVRMRIGVDLTGGTDPDAEHVIWGVENANMLAGIREWFIPTVGTDLYDPTDIYDPYTLGFVATSPDTSFFFDSVSDFAYTQSAVTIDDCALTALGWQNDLASGESPETGAETPTEAATPTETPFAPTPTPAVEGSPTEEGVIEVTPLGDGESASPTPSPNPDLALPLLTGEYFYRPNATLRVRAACSAGAADTEDRLYTSGQYVAGPIIDYGTEKWIRVIGGCAVLQHEDCGGSCGAVLEPPADISYAGDSLTWQGKHFGWSVGSGWTAGVLLGDQEPYDAPSNRQLDEAYQGVCGDRDPIVCELEEREPDIMVILIGTNDLHSGITPEVFKARLERIVVATYSWYAQPFLTTLPPSGLMDVARYNVIIKDVAIAYNVPVIDLYAELVTLQDKGLLSDGVHLTDEALQIRDRLTQQRIDEWLT